MILATRHPHLRCTSFDLPVVVPIAEKAIAAAGLADRVTVASGDFFADPLPQADVITMGLILHDWNLERKMHLIKRRTRPSPKAARSSSSRTSSTTPGARTRSG